jgi:Tfp pilus assembly protein PilE
MDRDENVVVNEQPGWILPAVVILALLAIAGLGYAYYDSTQLTAAQQAISGQMKSAQQDFSQQISTLQQKESQAEASNAQLESDLGVVTKRLRVTQGDLQKARDEAAQIQKDSEQKIADLDTNVNTQLATKASTDDLNATNGTVTGVKTDLESTKSDLQMARSELGTLIARNHDEIDTLRRMGERDYVEFSIDAKNKPQKVGPMTVELHSVNAKKNQFSVSVIMDDVRTDKNNRTVNEPIIVYPRGSHQADEFVVNTVGKDKVTGYISVPKNPGTTTSASGS